MRENKAILFEESKEKLRKSRGLLRSLSEDHSLLKNKDEEEF